MKMPQCSKHLKILLTIVTFALFCTSCNQIKKESQDITPEEESIAKGLIQGAFDDLWAGVDSTKILNYHTEDFIIFENGEVWDNDRIKKFMRSQLENKDRPKRINIMDYISIEKYGSSMQIAYHNKAEFYANDSLVFNGSWLESALAVQTDDG